MKGKCRTLIQLNNGWLAVSNHFHVFTQSIKFYYTFHYHLVGVQMLEKCN